MGQVISVRARTAKGGLRPLLVLAALAPLLDLAQWADGVLLAGDIGRNSETTVLLETFMSKYHG